MQRQQLEAGVRAIVMTRVPVVVQVRVRVHIDRADEHHDDPDDKNDPAPTGADKKDLFHYGQGAQKFHHG